MTTHGHADCRSDGFQLDPSRSLRDVLRCIPHTFGPANPATAPRQRALHNSAAGATEAGQEASGQAEAGQAKVQPTPTPSSASAEFGVAQGDDDEAQVIELF